ncbi:uncharacterized protein METZ01_LOCUS263268 [marine metagenome]|uniref:Uncharacterized protein n=1 Tax=marine metagenome TaxID=408172 RepID=A0A382JDP9_9ZZZZ
MFSSPAKRSFAKINWSCFAVRLYLLFGLFICYPTVVLHVEFDHKVDVLGCNLDYKQQPKSLIVNWNFKLLAVKNQVLLW